MAIIKIASKRRGGKWSRKRIIVVGAIAIVVIVGGVVAWWLLLGRGGGEEEIKDRGMFEVLEEESSTAQARYEERDQFTDEASLKTPEEKYQYHMARSNDLKIMGRYDEAVAAIEEAGKSGVKLDDTYYFSLGIAYEGKGDKAKALSAYEKSYDLASRAEYDDESDKRVKLSDIQTAIDRVKD